MNCKFINNVIDISEKIKSNQENSCFLENNERQILHLSEFLMNEKSLFLLNGFSNSGKSKLLDFVKENLKEDVLEFSYMCFETSTLDDMLLLFYLFFHNYILAGKIPQPKVKVDNFAQKINAYFNSVGKPIYIQIDSFEAILKENKPEIINFIKHLSTIPNVKIIISSRKYLSDILGDIEHEEDTILALSPKLFEKYLKQNGIKQIGAISNEFYKLSKGYYNNVRLALQIIKMNETTLMGFMEEYSTSYMTFQEFIVRKLLEFVDPVSSHLFRLLTVMRRPVHKKLLGMFHLLDSNRAEFFVESSILEVKDDCYYVKDTFRDVLELQIPENVEIKLHKSCIDLYNTQLPLKPFERDIMISRQTMRNEIEYHSIFIPKKPMLDAKVVRPLLVEARNEEVQESVEVKSEDIPVERTNKISEINFIFDDDNLLSDIAGSISQYIEDADNVAKLEKESSSLSITQLLNQAKDEENNYNYKGAIILYQNALLKTHDDDFYTFLPDIYTKLGQNYEKLSQWYEALEYYTQAQDFYINISNKQKACELKLSLANVYYQMYKIDNAKFLLKEIEKIEELSSELKIRVYMFEARLSDDENTELEHYKKALSYVDNTISKPILGELYYKAAAITDEIVGIKEAVKLYKACIELDTNPAHNPYLSRALQDCAKIYDELGSTANAIKYYMESIKVDNLTNNYTGLYYSAYHLGEIYSATDDKVAMDYYLKALDFAKKLNEPFYIVDTLIILADFYDLRNSRRLAYKYLDEAYRVAQKNLTHENLIKIQERLTQVQRGLSEQEIIDIKAENEK